LGGAGRAEAGLGAVGNYCTGVGGNLVSYAPLSTVGSIANLKRTFSFVPQMHCKLVTAYFIRYLSVLKSLLLHEKTPRSWLANQQNLL
jgi:hypothetical protein